jgi:uncharacterized metal-binding protein YceD (DUF177 family)
MKIRRPKSPQSRSSAVRPEEDRRFDKSGVKTSGGRTQERGPVHVAGAMTAPSGPFSRQIEVAQAEDKTLRVTITASEAECADLARQDDLPAIAQLSARFEVDSAGRGRFVVKGEVRARVTQICVVSLDPFETDIVQPVEVTFASPRDVEEAEAAYARRHEEDPDAEDIPEPPDPIFNGRIDLGVLAAEQLVLALDPYPRKEGVEFVADLPQVDDIMEISPFAALAKLKKDPKEG